MSRFFFDNSVMPRLKDLLDVFDRASTIEHLRERFDAATKDTDWIAAVSKWNPRPVVVTVDNRILRNKAEAEVLRESGLTFVVFQEAWARLSWEDAAWKYLQVWPKVRHQVQIATPTIFTVPISAHKVEIYSATAQVGLKKGGR